MIALPVTTRNTRPRITIWVVAIMQSQQDLHKVVPDGLLWYWAVMLLRLFDDRRQVSPSTIFHKNVQRACVAVNVAVVILYNMFVVEILQDIASGVSGQHFPDMAQTT